MHINFPLQNAKGFLVNLQKTNSWTRCPSVSSPSFWGHPCSAPYPRSAFIWQPQFSCLQKCNNNNFISLQTISAAALLPPIPSELLARGLQRDSDHRGAKPTSCSRDICILQASTALSKLPTHLPPSDLEFVTDTQRRNGLPQRECWGALGDWGAGGEVTYSKANHLKPSGCFPSSIILICKMYGEHPTQSTSKLLH